MTDKEKEQWAKDFDNIAIEMQEKYGIGEDRKIDISQMSDEDLKKTFVILGKFPIGGIKNAPFTESFILKIMWEMHSRNIKI